jgi:hypothetical protein
LARPRRVAHLSRRYAARMGLSAVDRLEFSDVTSGHCLTMHMALDKFYHEMVWHTGRGWNVDCFGMSARDVPTRDEAMEVVRMWMK